MVFFLGDELGQVKQLHPTIRPGGIFELSVAEIAAEQHEEKQASVQIMAIDADAKKLSVGRSDASNTIYSIGMNHSLTSVLRWTETRVRAGQEDRYVGLSMKKSGIYTCTSAGYLRFVQTSSDEEAIVHKKSLLPKRLTSFQLHATEDKFAYGGQEVDLSIWDVSRTFLSDSERQEQLSQSAKRKANSSLFPAELWRAKNEANDGLNLRRPMHITSLTFLSTSNDHELVAGAYNGSVKRYDTRAARRPVVKWEDVIKDGGVKLVKKSMREHELFVSSTSSSLSSVDLRNGKILYTYKGVSGAITSIAQTPDYLVSTSLDRLVRLHSTSCPPSFAGDPRSDISKPKIQANVFWKTSPTSVIWDGANEDLNTTVKPVDDADRPEDMDTEIWDNIGAVSDQDSENEGHPRTKCRKY